MGKKSYTTATQDKEVLKESLSLIIDEMLVNEIVDRELFSNAFGELKRPEQQAIIDKWADVFGHTKQKDKL